jgi:capsular polysaccharide transport system permease protein
VVTWAIIRPAEEHGVSIIAFVVSSYMPMALWRHIIFRSMQCVRANAQLLYHRAVTPMDILTSRLLLELAGGTLAFIATYGLLQAFGYLEPVADIGTVIGGWLLLFWYSAGQGMLAAAWTEASESADKLIPPLTYLILPFSGMFFMADWLPSAERALVLLVPNVHCFEMIRSGVFGPSVQTYWDAGYVAAWSLGLSAAGLLAMRKVRKHVRFE